MQRKVVSLTVFFSFILLCISSIVLYMAPEGRVAYWGNWQLLGVSKSQWSALHIVGGLLFLVTSIWHIVLNWWAIVKYLQNKARQATSQHIPALAALAICFVIYGGTLLEAQPMKQIVTWNLQLKAWQAKVNGNPPFGHAELSHLEKLCAFLKIDLPGAIEALQKAGLKGSLSPQTTILEIAQNNGMTPQQVFLVIKPWAGGKKEERPE